MKSQEIAAAMNKEIQSGNKTHHDGLAITGMAQPWNLDAETTLWILPVEGGGMIVL